MDTLVIVPSYNEAGNLVRVLPALCTGVGFVADVLVVDDGSTDQTAVLCEQYPIAVVSHPWNMGYSAALLTGYQYAMQHGYRYVLQADADGQHDAGDLLRVLQALRSDAWDLVIGSRFLGDRSFTPGSLKAVAIHACRSLIRLFTRVVVTDPTSGIRGLSKPVFTYYGKQNYFPSDYPDADFVVDVVLRGWRIREVGVGHHARMSGTSMHAGWKPVFYLAKMVMSMAVTLLQHRMGGKKGYL